MNYKKQYNLLIEKAQNQNRKKYVGYYYEDHHITPKWLNGSDDKDNRVLLTYREHFVAHWLLTKFANRKDKAVYAFWRMCNSDEFGLREMTSRQYETAKKKIIELLRNREFSKEHREKIGMAHKGRVMSKETREKMSNAHSGKTLSDDHKRKIGISSSRSLMGHKVSKETREKLRKCRTGTPTWYKKYTITFPNGDQNIVENLSKFCRENDLNVAHMSSCVTGKAETHKGYKCEYYEKNRSDTGKHQPRI